MTRRRYTTLKRIAWLRAFGCGLALSALGVSASAATLSVAPSQDTTLFADNNDFASGAGSFSFIGSVSNGAARRTLWQFDLSAIPVGSQINSVSLRFVINRAALQSSTDDLANLHRLQASWGEGASDGGTGGGGTQATPEDATWAYRFFGGAVPGDQLSWTSLGGDFAATASAATNLTGLGTQTFTSTAGLINDVTAWVNDPSSNFGWIMIGPEGPNADQTARRIHSREALTASERPTLVIDYAPVPLPATLLPLLSGLGILTAVRFRR
jgi:hypothetical protein